MMPPISKFSDSIARGGGGDILVSTIVRMVYSIPTSSFIDFCTCSNKYGDLKNRPSGMTFYFIVICIVNTIMEL